MSEQIKPTPNAGDNSTAAVNFVMIGDYGQTTPEQTLPVDRLAAMIEGWSPDFIMALGDNNYIAGYADTIDVNVGKNFAKYIYPKGTYTPSTMPGYPSGGYPGGSGPNQFFPILGNHDYNDPSNSEDPTETHIGYSTPYVNYFEPALTGSPGVTLATGIDGYYEYFDLWKLKHVWSQFTEPIGVNPRCYKLSKGPVVFFVLDTNCPSPYAYNSDGSNGLTPQSQQGIWLQQQLAASTATWKIVLFHEPAYTSGSGSTGEATMTWPFQAWGATAVVAGHVHNYERLAVTDPGGKITIPYFVNGAGGFVPEGGFYTPLSESLVRVENYGVQKVYADADQITFEYYDIFGVCRDSYAIYSDATQAPSVVGFDSGNYYVAADGGTVTLYLTRTGDLSAELSVDYNMIPGTAEPNTNYSPTSGTVTFDANAATASIAVNIVNVESESPVLTFQVQLTAPGGDTTLGFFNTATVSIDNTDETPVNDTLLFINQTYEDLLMRQPTATEVQQAQATLGTSTPQTDATACATFIVNYVLSPANYANELVFKTVQCFGALLMGVVAAEADYEVLPTYTDISTWTDLLENNGLANGLWQVAQALNMDAINAYFDELGITSPGATDFITGVYRGAFGITQGPSQDDLTYWQNYATPPVTTDAESWYQMLSVFATAPTPTPPPNSKLTLTQYNLPVSNMNVYLLATMIAGLTRQQMDYPTFNGIVTHGISNAVLIDYAAHYLTSAAYVTRFLPSPTYNINDN
jgi:tartrate-resistant acid phosphatase type 5